LSSPAKLIIAILFACGFLVAVPVVMWMLMGSGLDVQEQELLAAVVERRLGALLMIMFAACVFVFLLMRTLHEFLVLPPARAAEEAAAMLDQPSTRLSEQGERANC